LPVDDDGKVALHLLENGPEQKPEIPESLHTEESGSPQKPVYTSTMVDFASLNVSPAQKTEIRATLMVLVVCTIEISDVIFSMDTIAAISSQIPDLYLAFTCVSFALLTLRATFFIMEVLAEMFSLMKYGIACILIYIGVKLLIDQWVLVPHVVDLSVLLGTFGVTFAASAFFDKASHEENNGVTAGGERTEFVVTLEKTPGDVLGLDMDSGDKDKLRITEVKDGLVSKWNNKNVSMQVKPGDYITDMNGINGDSKAMLDVVESATSHKMTITRM
jgi:hypothetical protein